VHDAVVEAVERGFMTDAESSQLPGREAPSAPVASTLAVADDTEQVHLVWAWPGVARTDEDREALDVANHVLGGGLSSRLFDEIRERRGLAYAVYSGTIAYADSGAVSLYVGTMPEHVDEVRDVLEYEIERLVTGGVTPEELEIAVGYLTGSYELGLDDTGARMARAGGQWTTLGRVIPVEEQIHRWRNVTGDDVDRVLNRTLAGPRISVAVGPVDHRRGG
jgi:predicted Zn-dependent peptidase